jgi:hypothetical protein
VPDRRVIVVDVFTDVDHVGLPGGLASRYGSPIPAAAEAPVRFHSATSDDPYYTDERQDA